MKRPRAQVEAWGRKSQNRESQRLTQKNIWRSPMHNRYKFLLALPLCGALALAACGTAQKDWTNASTVNTVSSYQAFLDKHPKDEHAQEAQTRIAALQDDAAWKTAQGGNSSDSYQAYLQAEPNGTHAQAARDAIRGSIARTRGRRPNRTARRRRCKHSCKNTPRGLKRTRHGRSSPQSSPTIEPSWAIITMSAPPNANARSCNPDSARCSWRSTWCPPTRRTENFE